MGIKRSTSRGRVYPQSYSTDRRIGRLRFPELSLYPLMWVNADDQGRLIGDPEEIKYAVCPNVDQLTKTNIPRALAALEKHELIIIYETPKGPVIQMLDWWDVHRRPQWAWPSEYPPPNGWKDHLRFKRGKKEVVKINWPPWPSTDVSGEGGDESQVSAGILSGEFSGETEESPPPYKDETLNMKDEDEDESHLNPQVNSQVKNESSLSSSDIVKIYERDIGAVTPGVEEELQAACSLYPPAWVKDAIRVAVKAGPNAKNLRYIAGVLENYAKERGEGGAREPIREISVEELVPGSAAEEIWRNSLEELRGEVTKSYYRTWLEKTVGVSYEGTHFTVGVPNSYVAEYLNQMQRSLIEKVLICHTCPEVTLSFVVVRQGGDVK